MRKKRRVESKLTVVGRLDSGNVRPREDLPNRRCWILHPQNGEKVTFVTKGFLLQEGRKPPRSCPRTPIGKKSAEAKNRKR